MTQAGLERLIARALVASRTSASNAASVARALAQAEADGQKGHGVSRVPSYAAQAKVGKIEGNAAPSATLKCKASLMVDAAHGFAYPAVDLALARLPALAREAGLAAAGIVRSHHFGVAGHHVERLAEAGLLALAFANTPSAIAAAGGRHGVFGTNPIAFSAPRRGGPPLVVDLALSEVARGRILMAATKGEPIPLGWAVDKDGQPTTDGRAALQGTLLPIGGPKGAALALMVEVLAVALTGARFAYEASSFLDDKGGPPATGQLLLAIDPDAFAGRDVLLERIEALAAEIESDGARLPGARRLAARAKAAREGISVDPRILAEVEALAAATGA